MGGVEGEGLDRIAGFAGFTGSQKEIMSILKIM
jgi:hypothetical protein